MGARARVVRMLAVVACAVGLPALVWCGSAAAKLTHPYVLTFGSFSDVQGVAVESKSGDVYVYDGGKGEVRKFDASGSPVNFSSTGTNAISGVGSASSDEGEIAVDSSTGPAKGDIYIAHADGTVNIYSEAGTKLGELSEKSPTPWGEACGVAVDSSGNVYVGLYGSHVNKYVPSANPVTNTDYVASISAWTGLCNVAADSAGNVFTDKWGSGPVTRYEAGQFGSSSASGSVVDQAGSTLAVDPANDEVYVDERNQVSQFGPHGMPFEAPVARFASSGAGAISGSLGIAVSGFNHDVYVSDGKGAVGVFGPQTLETVPPVIEEQYATDVAGTSATLSGQLNAEGRDTTYHFEYGLTVSYGSSTPEMGAGSSLARTLAEAHVQGLLQSTSYHYRLVATNSVGTVTGPDMTFTTQGVGGQLTLLDGRQWEEVSPQEKHGAQVEAQPFQGGVIQASEDGNAITYLTNDPIDAEPEGNRGPETTQVMARRVAGGWLNRTIATRHEETQQYNVGRGPEYRMFSPDLTHSLLEPRSSVALDPRATEPTPYVRDEAACEAGSGGCFTALVTPEDTQPGAKWSQSTYLYGPTTEALFLLASSDLSHVVLRSGVALTSGAPTGFYAGQFNESGLYEWSDGQLRFVSVQPPAEGGKEVFGELGYADRNVRNAVSADGSRIVWQESCGSYCKGPLYMRDTSKEETIRLSPVGTKRVEFDYATADGSHVFFTAESSLYSCDIAETAGKLACDLSEVAGSGVKGVLGAGEDGKTVYFVSRNALTAGAQTGACEFGKPPVPTQCNLYVAHFDGSGWELRFIAGLETGQDVSDWIDDAGYSIGGMTSRVSPNGRFVAFMSERSLTGYDNHDALSGERDEEVFLYDDGAQRLICASCNPTGARPHGYYQPKYNEGFLVSEQLVWTKRWFAGIVPGYDNLRAGEEEAIRQPRYLSDAGQLFFESPDALVPQDTNGLEDVYEYEPEGAGRCVSSASSYSGRAYGCVGLISSGSSPEESAFLEANASATDVFFMTSAKLTSQDQDTAYDVYDAHVCSSSVPCAQPPVLPPPCNSGDSCKGPPSPQPAIFGSPASSTFSGQGNVVALPSKVTQRNRGLSRAQKLARALKQCKKRDRHGGKRLRACERRARARYGRAARSSSRAGGRGLASVARKSGHNGRGR